MEKRWYCMLRIAEDYACFFVQLTDEEFSIISNFLDQQDNGPKSGWVFGNILFDQINYDKNGNIIGFKTKKEAVIAAKENHVCDDYDWYEQFEETYTEES